jgi:glutaconate CoA-transferase subunit A
VGLVGIHKEVAFAAKHLVVVVEDVVDDQTIRQDPNRTIIPGLIVDAVVREPFGAHPSYVQGYYDRDNQFYLNWDKISRDQQATEKWLQEWVYDVPNRESYLNKLGSEKIRLLAPGEMWAKPVNYGRYD